jgi:threonine dehydratase
VFWKCENFQRAGAFKFRGAFSALSNVSPLMRTRRGVLAFSSGNHAQAIALSGRLLSMPTVVVMPNDAPGVKVRATREYGAEVVLYDRNLENREELGERFETSAAS